MMILICIYILSNTWATFETQFMKELSNTEAELKKSHAYIKKACIQWKRKSHVNGICFMYHVKKCLHSKLIV